VRIFWEVLGVEENYSSASYEEYACCGFEEAGH
jgi:hypothetical protein